MEKYASSNLKHYHGYTVYPDGRFEKNGKVVTYQKNGQLSLVINGKRKAVQGVRIMYSLYKNGGEPLDRKQIVVFIDGNKEHRHIDNLKCISKREYDLITKKKQPSKSLSDKEVKEIRELYGLDEEQRKKARNQMIHPSISYRKLAVKYGVHFTTIQRVIQGYY